MPHDIPRYTNADLTRRSRPSTDLTRDIAFWDPSDPEFAGRGQPGTIPDEGPEQDTEILLQAARTSLGRAEKRAPTLPRGDFGERAAALSEGSSRPSLRGLTQAMQTASIPLGLASVAVPAAGVPAALLAAPDVLRRLVVPEEGEGRAGAVGEAALYAAAPFAGRAIGAAGRAGRRVFQRAGEFFEGPAPSVAERFASARAAGREPAMRLGSRAEIPFASQQTAVNPNQVIALAREIAEETGVPVETVLKGYSRGGGAEQMTPLRRLLGAGPRAQRARVAERVGLPEDAPVDPRDFLGERTTGSFPEGSGGLSDIAAGRFERYPLPPGHRYQEEVDTLLRESGLSDVPAFSAVGEAVQPGRAFPPAAEVPALTLQDILGMARRRGQ